MASILQNSTRPGSWAQQFFVCFVLFFLFGVFLLYLSVRNLFFFFFFSRTLKMLHTPRTCERTLEPSEGQSSTWEREAVDWLV